MRLRVLPVPADRRQTQGSRRLAIKQRMHGLHTQTPPLDGAALTCGALEQANPSSLQSRVKGFHESQLDVVGGVGEGGERPPCTQPQAPEWRRSAGGSRLAG